MSRPSTSPTVRSTGEGLFSLPVAAQVFVCATITLGFLCLFLAVPRLDISSPAWLAVLFVVGLGTATIHLPLPLVQGRSSISVSHAVVVMAMLTSGTAAAALLVVGTSLVQSTVRTRLQSRPHRTLFNIGSLALTVTLAGATYSTLHSNTGGWVNSVGGPLACAELVYFVVNTVLVALAVALTSQQSLLAVWRSDFMWMGPGYFISAFAAGAAHSLTRENVYWWMAIAVIFYLTVDAYRTYIARMKAGQQKAQQALEVQFGIVQALAAAIESKDRTSQGELHRFMVYAEELARAAGLDEAELYAVRTAALLHDIGNLAVPEHILSKAGELTSDEFERVKIHTRVGADILRNVPFDSPVAPLILSHHERWDGSGYPSGLKGDAIPLGARILAVADCFSALLSDRPYRPAFSAHDALTTLQQWSGTWLDPMLVDRFIDILPVADAKLDTETQRAALPSPYSDAAPLSSESAFEDIAGAHHEARALFEMAQALTSTQGVAEAVDTIVSKFAALIPIHGGALFLLDAETERLSCHYASGVEREVLTGIHDVTFDALEAHIARDVEAAGGAAPTVIVTRLGIGDRHIGAMALVGPARGARGDWQRLLEHIAPQVGLVIQNAIAFEETRQLSLTDPLTELPNRRYLLQHLDLELARADRHGSPVALLLMDVNDFKEINDTLGHNAGDFVLREIGRVAGSLLRPYDVCARFGGDEFVLVLWDCDSAQAERRRHELEESIAGIRVEASGAAPASTSVSIGIAVYPMDGRNTDQLLAVADEKMYERKALGKAARGTTGLARQGGERR